MFYNMGLNPYDGEADAFGMASMPGPVQEISMWAIYPVLLELAAR